MNDYNTYFKNKILMITGGTGSFGNAVLSKFLETDLKEIRIFSRDEKKQDDLRNQYKNSKLKFIIGDVRSRESISIASRNVDFIFHAAALKQVPSCEFYPMEAIKTNVEGTNNLIEAAFLNSVERVVVLSTDKAVYPINAMGMTKALAEKLVVAKSRTMNENEVKFTATRYGNVMASRGSVIPLFVEQAISGENITLTDPNMTRFMMSLPQSVDLVLHAFLYGQQGDLFVRKSPACTIETLARAIKDIFNSKSKISYIGTRHGEKIYETLVSREEMSKAVSTENYFKIPMDNRSLNYESFFSEGSKSINNYDDYTSHNTQRLDIEETKTILKELDYIREKLCLK